MIALSTGQPTCSTGSLRKPRRASSPTVGAIVLIKEKRKGRLLHHPSPEIAFSYLVFCSLVV